MPNIIVDIHEKDSGLFEDIFSRNMGDCTEEYLISGDVSISHNDKTIGIEIKREADFTNSLHSGRLSNQIVNMAELFDMSFLIVENWHPFLGDNDDEYTLADKVRKHELTIRTLNRRLITYETKNQNETIDLISEIIGDLTSGKLFRVKRKAVCIEIDTPSIVMLASLPNVGIERATAILNRFLTPLNAFSKIDEWETLKIGLTADRIDKIKEILGSD